MYAKEVREKMWPEKFGKEGLTFDDVMVIPAATEVQPRDVDTTTNLTKDLKLNIPFMRAGMAAWKNVPSPIHAVVSTPT